MSHLIADTPQELIAIVDKIGVQRKWFQSNASIPHFDIAQSKRMLAIANGAIVLERNEFVAAFRRIRATWPRTADNRWIL